MKKFSLLLLTLCLTICTLFSQSNQSETNTTNSASGTVYVGNINSTKTVQNSPISVAWENGISQTIYFEEEINQTGLITDFMLTFFGNNYGNAPVEAIYHFYFAITNKVSFDSLQLDWIPYDDFTLVYSGTLPLNGLIGRHDIHISLDTPYIYNGGNLVLMGYRQYYNSYGADNSWIHTDSPNSDHARSISQVNANNAFYPPFDPYPSGSRHYSFANIELTFDVSGAGNLTGIVTLGSSDTPAPNVEITLDGTNRTALTNANGIYLMEYIESGIIGITAKKTGYLDYSYTGIQIITNQTTTHNFSIQESPYVIVSGRVLASDTNQPLSNVSVGITGYDIFPIVQTNEQGYFSVPNVFTNQSYVIVVNASGYAESKFPIEVTINDLDVGDIFAFEHTYPPSNFLAEILEEYMFLSWIPPTRGLETYNIFRALNIHMSDPTLWETIATGVTGNSYNDYSWYDLDGGIFRYFITSVYTNDNESVPAMSNIVRYLPVGSIFIGNLESEIPINVPFNYLWETSIAQTIYLEEEINFIGTIKDIAYRYNGSGNVPANIIHKVWMGITDKVDFVAGDDWVDYENFTLVFEGTLPVNLPGVTEIVITLDDPFQYSRGNLVIMTQRLTVGTYQQGNVWQHTLTAGEYRTLHAYRDGADFNPQAIPAGILEFTFANIVLTFDIEETGDLEGIVTDSQSVPLAEVEINIIGTERRVFTNDSGEYFMPFLPSGNIDIIATKHGYQDVIIPNIEIIANQTKNENITMLARPQVALSGRVISSKTNNAIISANVTLSGYEDYYTTTNSLGEFLFPSVYGDNIYTFFIRSSGYESYIDTSFEISTNNISMGDILLYERAIPVKNVQAVVQGNDVRISWDAPGSLENNWITHVQSNHLGNHIGVNMPALMIKAHRYTQEQLQQLGVSGAELTKVAFVPRIVDAIISTTVQIYSGGSGSPLNPGTLIYSQPVTETLVENWVEVVLNRPIKIPAMGELWIAIEYIVLGGTPLGTDAGPAIKGHGNIFYFSSLGWCELSDGAPTLDFNFSIRAYVEGAHAVRLIYASVPPISASVPPISASVPPISDRHSSNRTDGVSPSKYINGGTPFVHAVPPISDRHASNLSVPPISDRHTFIPPITTSTTRDLLGYNVYRTRYLNSNSPDLWTHLTFTTNNEYLDTEWSSLLPDGYFYIIEAVYSQENLSDPRFSKILPNNILSQVTINLTTTNTDNVSGAKLTLENNSGDLTHVYQHTFTDNMLVLNDVWQGDYTLTISHNGYMTHINNSLSINSAIFTHYVTLVNTNVVIDEDFQTLPFPPADWTMIDADGDGNNWIRTNWTGETGYPPPKEWYAASESAKNTGNWVALTPDNYLISKPFTIQNGGSALISLLVGTISPAFPIETYSVMISNTTPTVEAFTTIYTETLNSRFYIWEQRQILVNDIYGDNIYVAIRHHDSENMHLVGITNFKVEVSEAPPVLEPPRNAVAVVQESPEIILNWEAPETDIPIGYIVHRNNEKIADIHTSTYLVDTVTSSGDYIYAVRAVYTMGVSEPVFADPVTCIVSDADIIVELDTALVGNYPNPFNPNTTISFDLKNDTNISIEIFNIRGQKVRNLLNDFYFSGSHNIEWDGNDDNNRSLASGVYFYRMKTDDFTDTKRMVLMK